MLFVILLPSPNISFSDYLYVSIAFAYVDFLSTSMHDISSLPDYCRFHQLSVPKLYLHPLIHLLADSLIAIPYPSDLLFPAYPPFP